MESKALHLILLTSSVFAVASTTFTHGSDATGDKAARAIWRDKGSDDNGDYKFNTGYPTAYGIEEQRGGDGHTRGTYKDGASIIDTHGNSGKLSQGNSNHHQGAKDATGNSDGYNQNYKHGYRHSHGYGRHRHRSNGKGENGAGDGYQGYHRFRHEHDHDGRNDGGDRGCGHAGCKYGSYTYNDGFEFHYGNSGKGHDGRNYNGDNSHHGGYNGGYEQNDEHRLGHRGNEGVDDHGPDYHYGYAQSDDNYDKDYPSFASDHHYRHREQDYDQLDHRHGLVHRDH
ncbi:uncharacterized protein LOC143376473 [Andrena cerasifolii]|uniref:uncharacterized protein LOC143376473 n=1 Tax=Andrena cerasifolii TaxID=2819439 RepID=UPI0040379865